MPLLTGSWLLDAVLVLAPLLYWYMTRHFGFWKRLGVPYMRPTPFVGNMGGVVLGRQHMGEPVLECYRRAGDAPFMGMFAFDQPLLMVKDPQLVGRIMSTDFSTFYATNAKIDPVTDPVIAASLFGQHGPGWKKLRSLLSPAFTSGKIKLMFHLVNEVGQSLARHLEDAVSKGDQVELKDLTSRYTTDAVCSVFMGVNVGTLEDPGQAIRRHLRNVLREGALARVATTIAFFAPRLLSIFRVRLGDKVADDYFLQSTVKVIEYRRKNGIVRNDLIDMLLKIQEKQLSEKDEEQEVTNEFWNPNDNGYKMTNESIAGQLTSFLRAGFDTSSSTLVFALWELARNRELQDRVRRGVRRALRRSGGDVTWEALADMDDLNNVTNEALRMYPPANFLDREASRDYQIPGTDLVLPRGTGVVISVTGLHHDPRYWKEPHRFNPDRFKEEESRDRPSYTFLPFSVGPRTCIGMRVAYLQVKIGLLHILNSFEVYEVPETPKTMYFDPSKLIVTPADDVIVGFRKIPPEQSEVLHTMMEHHMSPRR